MAGISRRTLPSATGATSATILPTAPPGVSTDKGVPICAARAEKCAAATSVATPSGATAPNLAPRTTYLFFNAEQRARRLCHCAIFSIVVLAGLVAGPARPADAVEPAANVDAARITAADRDPANWMTYGRTYSEQRFSPLARIVADNVRQLGLAWYANLDTNRGQEATPLVIDGVLYVSTAWSIVKAFDAKTGLQLWSYDPEVPRALGVRGCCDVVSRGVAAWKGKIFVATFDGRLIALDARTGRPVWNVMTVDPDKPYTITQAPRVIKGRVVIGNSGSEYGVRGYISAYDAETGKLDWRFYTVPGDPSQPPEQPILSEAAKTWHGDWWTHGGGGVVWESLSYDPELNLIYFGVGNGNEWNQEYRSQSEGDNLFLSSIVAVNADTGIYAWHYQATPGEEWDFDAVQQLILADLPIGGITRKVVMQANKNGFFYVLDRTDGKLISAKNFTPVTWASGIDPRTGRPIEAPGIRFDKSGKPASILPGALGAHSWQAMAFNPKTGLVYIPAQEIGMTYESVKDFKRAPIGWNIGMTTTNRADVKGYLVAWDPMNQKEVWRANYMGPWNGGILTTAGNLVIQGNAAGFFSAYRADTGEKLWSMASQSAIMAAPATYEVDGEQYIAVLSGWGGAYPLLQGKDSDKSGNTRNVSRVLVFKLGGKASLPPLPPEAALPLDPPPDTADVATIKTGEALFGRFCGVCHGEAAVGGGVVPDLRTSPFIATTNAWNSILVDGALRQGGMAPFAQVLDRTQATAIRDYVIHRANEDAAAGAAQTTHKPDPNHGAVIVAQGTASGAPACAKCHAFTGSSDSSGAFPRVAGQPAAYLTRQLTDFRSGARANALMSQIARALSVDDADDVAAYYAGVETPFPPLADPDLSLVKKGRELAETGDPAKGIPACGACHGAGGAGEPPTLPYLAGQYAHYTAFELQMWRRGLRRNSLEAMALFASKLDDQQIQALAAYYQQARPSVVTVRPKE
jgi:quinohemoprotein ethanol dehydrogenase